MSRRALSIVLSESERKVLSAWSRSRKLPSRQVQRANIVLMAVAGRRNQESHYSCVSLVRRYNSGASVPRSKARQIGEGCAATGTQTQAGAGQDQQLVEATLNSTPIDATHWSVRSMARAQKLSPSAVHRYAASWSEATFGTDVQAESGQGTCRSWRMSSAVFEPPDRRWCYVLMRRRRFRHWIERNPVCR